MRLLCYYNNPLYPLIYIKKMRLNCFDYRNLIGEEHSLLAAAGNNIHCLGNFNRGEELTRKLLDKSTGLITSFTEISDKKLQLTIGKNTLIWTYQSSIYIKRIKNTNLVALLTASCRYFFIFRFCFCSFSFIRMHLFKCKKLCLVAGISSNPAIVFLLQ